MYCWCNYGYQNSKRARKRGCARLITDKDGGHIGRLAVKKKYRGRHIGADICRFVIDYCRAEGYDSVWLNSQLHAVGFYEKLGFVTEGEFFVEADIKHIKMVKKLIHYSADTL